MSAQGQLEAMRSVYLGNSNRGIFESTCTERNEALIQVGHTSDGLFLGLNETFTT